jgi:DNA-binding winged helix-turn-helix (wHTH) protein
MEPPVRYRFGSFVLDTAGRQLLHRGRRVHLTPKEMDLLLLLLANQGRALTKEEILQSLWPHSVVEEGNLTQTVSLLRKALSVFPDGQDCIETVARHGYRFRSNLVCAGETAASGVGRPLLWFAIAGALAVLALWGWLFYILGSSR